MLELHLFLIGEKSGNLCILLISDLISKASRRIADLHEHCSILLGWDEAWLCQRKAMMGLWEW